MCDLQNIVINVLNCNNLTNGQEILLLFFLHYYMCESLSSDAVLNADGTICQIFMFCDL